MFFHSKKFEVVDVTNQSILILNKVNTLSFYIKDILSNTQITSLYYQVINKNGRDEVPIGTYIQITDITGDIAKFDYTPTDPSLLQIYFRIKLIDSDATEHIIHIDTYSVTV